MSSCDNRMQSQSSSQPQPRQEVGNIINAHLEPRPRMPDNQVPVILVTVFAKSRPRNYADTKAVNEAEIISDSRKDVTDITSNSLMNGDFRYDVQQAFKAIFPGADGDLRGEIFNQYIQQLAYFVSDEFPPFSETRHTAPFVDLEGKYGVEIIYDHFPATISKSPLRPIKLALFDMDSTLINEEVIDELARSIGKTDQVSVITAKAMNGEIDFETSLRRRVAMLKGVREDVWDVLKRTVTITEGARELIAGLKEMGVVTGVVSGGFIPMAEWLKEELGLDYAFANHLVTSPATSEISHAHLTGELSSDHPIVTPEFKRETLVKLAKQHNAPLSETFAVGDGSNDLPMLHKAGLGVAWNAKPKVQQAAPMRLNGHSLADLLFLFGERDE